MRLSVKARKSHTHFANTPASMWIEAGVLSFFTVSAFSLESTLGKRSSQTRPLPSKAG